MRNNNSRHPLLHLESEANGEHRRFKIILGPSLGVCVIALVSTLITEAKWPISRLIYLAGGGGVVIACQLAWKWWRGNT
jgi:hypothetical protein